MLENPLADVAGQEQSVCPGRRQGCEEPQLGRRQILRLVDHNMIERFCCATLKGFRQPGKHVRPGRVAFRHQGRLNGGERWPQSRALVGASRLLRPMRSTVE